MKPPYVKRLSSRIWQVTLAIFSILGGLALASGWAYPLIYNSIYTDPFPLLLLFTVGVYWVFWPMGITLVICGIVLIWKGISRWRNALRREEYALPEAALGQPAESLERKFK